MITQFNDNEDDLLQGLPLRAQVIYLRGLRRYMNYKTGVVGGPQRRISLSMLGEIACEEFNRKLQSPTKDGVRSSLDQLKRAGLIERIEDKDYLIFFLPKASTHNSVQNNNPTTTPQQPHNNPTHSTTPKPSNDAALSGNLHTPQNGANLEGGLTTPHIIYTDNGYTNIQPYMSPPASGGDESAGGEVVDISTKRKQPPPYQQIVDAYHEALPTLAQVYKLTETRKTKIKSLWADELNTIESWRNYFKFVSQSDFLMGRSPADASGRQWVADFDFLVNPSSFVKIAEEKYHGKKVSRR